MAPIQLIQIVGVVVQNMHVIQKRRPNVLKFYLQIKRCHHQNLVLGLLAHLELYVIFSTSVISTKMQPLKKHWQQQIQLVTFKSFTMVRMGFIYTVLVLVINLHPFLTKVLFHKYINLIHRPVFFLLIFQLDHPMSLVSVQRCLNHLMELKLMQNMLPV